MAGRSRQSGSASPVLDDSLLLAAIVDSSADAIVSVALDGTITSWNAAAAALYGYAADEAVGRSIARLHLADDALQQALAAVRAGQRVVHADGLRLRHDGTTIVVAESVSPVRDGDGVVVGAASISHDVTEEHRLAAALAEVQAQLEHNNRRLQRSNVELEQFAYIASHDLSEPLRAVAGMVQLLAKRYRGQLDDDADEFIAFAIEGCERLRAMIEDILTYSRVSRADLEPAPVALDEVVSDVTSALREQLDAAGVRITSAPLPEVHGDARQLRQVLQNLVSNAVKFRRPDVEVVVEVAAERRGDAWRVTVSDNGIGIEPEYRQRIFRMFQRLHVRDQYPGTGIGLSIAERIVDRHGGSIGVDGRPGGGSTFWFELPDGGR